MSICFIRVEKSCELRLKKWCGCLCNGIAGPVFEFLLFTLIPSGHIGQVSCHTGNLGYIMAAAFRADRLAAEGAVFDRLCDIVGTVAVVERAHNHQLCLTAAGTWFFIDNVVAGVALVPALFNGDIFKRGIFVFEAELFRRPVHGNILSNRKDIIIGVTIRKPLIYALKC